MNQPGALSKSSGSRWGWLAVAILLAFAAWQSGIVGKWLHRSDTVNQAWFDNYEDRILSNPITVRVVGKANQRPFPTAQGTEVIDFYPDGTRLKGELVRGADPNILWFRVGEGIYLWEGNLEIDPQILAKARQTSIAWFEAERSDAKGARAAPSGQNADIVDDAATTDAMEAKAIPTQTIRSRVTAPSPAPNASKELRLGFDAATSAAVYRAVSDKNLAGEIIANAEVVAPRDQQGSSSLTWAMCSSRCNFDYSSAVVLSGTGSRPRVQVCVHDSRRMAGDSDWYEPGRTPVRRPGLCPSVVAALE